MDKLRTLIQTLTKEERRGFEGFVKRLQNRKDRKDLALFRLLSKPKELKTSHIIEKLYGDSEQKMAYHALRKRLMKDLSRFLVLQIQETDETANASAMGDLALAKHLHDRGAFPLAQHYLNKATHTAESEELFEVLTTIYQLQVEWWTPQSGQELKMLIEQWEKAKAMADEEARASMAYAEVREELWKVQQEGLPLSFEPIIKEILKKYQLAKAVSQRPKLKYLLLSIARTAVLVRKDYYSFAPYLIHQYEDTEFRATHRYYQLGMIYMIAHVLYRSRQFNGAQQYLDRLSELIGDESASYYEDFHPKFVLLQANNYTFLGQNAKAIRLLEEFLEKNERQLSIAQKCDGYLNLGFVYYQEKEYSKASKIMLHFQHSDFWYIQQMGKEWAFKKSLAEAMFQFDLNNADLAYERIERIEKQYASLLSKPKYQNAGAFLLLLKHFFTYPQSITKSSFIDRVEGYLEFLPAEEEDLQAMRFYAWLKSKMMNQDYYTTLLELARG